MGFGEMGGHHNDGLTATPQVCRSQLFRVKFTSIFYKIRYVTYTYFIKFLYLFTLHLFILTCSIA